MHSLIHPPFALFSSLFNIKNKKQSMLNLNSSSLFHANQPTVFDANPSINTSFPRNGITRKCATLVKKQRARIYILRRCATMLLCWYIQGDD
ncbi:small polypeptide DEVIL 8 [Lactuca sativa]|uniref:small polypeptide DEVIL 8 n=1 Tax=Lactuca sativa TaxID=4236 RepID=UPI000CD8FB71|nr:small polypeptide DEVIL 8 [Lactuca sativa]